MTLAPETVERAVATWQRWQDAPPPDDLVSVVQIAGATFVQAPMRMLDRLGDIGTRVLGAARLSYADARTLRAPADDSVRAVALDDERLSRLAAVTLESEWWEAGFDDPVAVVGIDDGGSLASVAMLGDWFGLAGHIGVLTRSDRRGAGLATVTAGSAARRALERGLVPQWRARVGNDASQRVADRLGFVTLGVQLFVRLPAAGSPTMGA